jgi:hypothetical protein
MNPKYTIFTTLFGNYESLNELEISKRNDTRYLVITDNPKLKSASWEIKVVRRIFDDDPVRSQRYVKIMSHQFLESKYSMYMDNTVRLVADPISKFQHFEVKRYGLAFPDHDHRLTIRDELNEVLELKLDSKEILLNYLAMMEKYNLSVLKQKPYWTGIFFRHMNNPAVQKVMENWAMLVAHYSRRDQLTLNLALTRNGFAPNRVALPLLDSSFHKWPIHTDRVSNRFDF